MRKLIALSVLCLSPALATAGEITSVYTKFDSKTCKVLDPGNPDEEWGGSSLCAGYKDLKVYFASGDLRDLVAYGKSPGKHCAATQTFGPFNSMQDTIEWRLDGGKPFAVIQRFMVSDPEDSEKTSSWLAVTKLEDNNSCRVGAVQGSMKDANAVARKLADEKARNFNCETDEASVVSDPPGNEIGMTSGSPCGPAETGSNTAPGDTGGTSQYVNFDLDKCEVTEKADGFVFEGAWRCKGITGYDIYLAGSDDRNFAGFGTEAAENCALLKTFSGFNSFASPVEFRFAGGKPIAAIQRWSVVENPDTPDKPVSWLIVNKLDRGNSCQMHFVAGAYPDANTVARQVADIQSPAFDCEKDAPGYTSTTGAPDINLEPCSSLARE